MTMGLVSELFKTDHTKQFFGTLECLLMAGIKDLCQAFCRLFPLRPELWVYIKWNQILVTASRARLHYVLFNFTYWTCWSQNVFG